MKILITGAGGNLGRAIIPSLLKEGHVLRLMDFKRFDASCELFVGDVRNPEDVSKATEGMDAIIHGAALHGIHLGSHSIDEFWAINLNGAHNIFQAAIKHEIKKIIYCSTTDVYGDGIKVPDGEYREVTENNKNLPQHIYGFTKFIGEQMCSYYSRNYKIQTIALRLGIFLPEEFIKCGFRLLRGGIDERDVAQAVSLALNNDTIQHDFFNIMAKVPFSKEDEKTLATDPISAIKKYYPNAINLMKKHNISDDIFYSTCPWWGNNYWSVEKAESILGYKPKYNFKEFLEAWEKGVS